MKLKFFYEIEIFNEPNTAMLHKYCIKSNTLFIVVGYKAVMK